MFSILILGSIHVNFSKALENESKKCRENVILSSEVQE